MHVDAGDADVAADEVAADADLEAEEIDVQTEALAEIEEEARRRRTCPTRRRWRVPPPERNTERSAHRTRTCVGCRRAADPAGWVRVAVAKDGTLGAGPTQPGPGRVDLLDGVLRDGNRARCARPGAPPPGNERRDGTSARDTGFERVSDEDGLVWPRRRSGSTSSHESWASTTTWWWSSRTSSRSASRATRRASTSPRPTASAGWPTAAA